MGLLNFLSWMAHMASDDDPVEIDPNELNSDEYDEYDPDAPEERESEFDTLEEAINSVGSCTCPVCNARGHTFKNTGGGYFQCTKCGYIEDGEITVSNLGIW